MHFWGEKKWTFISKKSLLFAPFPFKKTTKWFFDPDFCFGKLEKREKFKPLLPENGLHPQSICHNHEKEKTWSKLTLFLLHFDSKNYTIFFIKKKKSLKTSLWRIIFLLQPYSFHLYANFSFLSLHYFPPTQNSTFFPWYSMLINQSCCCVVVLSTLRPRLTTIRMTNHTLHDTPVLLKVDRVSGIYYVKL